MKDAIDYHESLTPIADNVILNNILDAQEEIEQLYNTKFGSVEDTGFFAAGSTTAVAVNNDKAWCVDEFAGYVLWIVDGAGKGEYAQITGNTQTALALDPYLNTVPDTTSSYRITKLGFDDWVTDGTGLSEMFVRYQPIVELNSLDIQGQAVSASSVIVYNESGRLKLYNTSASVFLKNVPQDVEVKYFYGVYPVPRPIKRLAICIAGIKTLIAQFSGTYNFFSNVSLPGGVTLGKGNLYGNIQTTIETLQREAKGIVFGVQDELGNYLVHPSYPKGVIFG